MSDEDSMTSQKSSLREHALRTRAALGLDPSGMKHFSDLFLAHVPISAEAVVAGYWPIDRELDVRMLLDDLLERGFTVVLPVVQKDGKILKFARWNHETPMVRGSYGIMHPQSEDYIEPDIVIVPMLAFDRSGGRLGFGGGYYDATLGDLRARKKVLAVGVAYAAQACLFALPHEVHDQRMDWVVTEQAALSF